MIGSIDDGSAQTLCILAPNLAARLTVNVDIQLQSLHFILVICLYTNRKYVVNSSLASEG